MAPTTSTAVQPNSTPKTAKPLVPPEEKFWQRYSPHHEMLVSGAGSFTLHVLVVGGLFLAAALGLFSLLNKEEEPIPFGAIEVPGLPGAPGTPGGNFGTNGGAEPGTSDPNPPSEAVAQNDPPRPPDVPPLADIPRVKVNPEQFPELMQDPTAQSYVTENNDALGRLSKLSQETQKKLMQGLKEGSKASGGTPGPSGNNGQGGQPGGKLDPHMKRVLRWTMLFNTKDGADYIRQLAAMGAILAVPEGNNQYRVFRNLNQKPVQGQIEDPAEIKLIWWVDDRAESVRSLAEGIGLNQVPQHFVAFFPRDLENKLVELEHRYRNLREDQIQETRFQIVPTGNTYVPRVLDQIPKKR